MSTQFQASSGYSQQVLKSPVIGPAPQVLAMPVFGDHRAVSAKWHGGVYAMGNFDGLHIGHEGLIEAAFRIAARNSRSAALLTFEPHPRELFGVSDAPFRLSNAAQKVRRLASLGTRFCLTQNFDHDFAALSPQQFVDHVLSRSLRASHVVVGPDFCFGQRRAGNVSVLRQLCAAFGIGVTVVEPVAVAGAVASSSLIRALIGEGRMKSAAGILGRPWSVSARPRHIANGLAFDLLHYTAIGAGDYLVRIGDTNCIASLARHSDDKQVLSTNADLNSPIEQIAEIAFIS